MTLNIKRVAVRRISAGTLLESTIVIDSSRDPIASREPDTLLSTARITAEYVTEEQVRIARAAYRGLGQGSGHLAR